MGTFLLVLCALFWIVGAIGEIWLLFEAYSDDQFQGWLCLFFMPYGIYYCIAYVESPRKWIILALCLGGAIPGIILFSVAQNY